MSTIKSSAEDLTLNADGSNEIKFQINAVEKASINSSGLLTSTTIDATALTGNLPAIDGSSLTGISAGITEADQWRLTASATAPSGDITTNLERVDTSGQGTLGTGMTESSGIFSFPSTGIYLIQYTFNVRNPGSGVEDRAQVSLIATTDNSSYVTLATPDTSVDGTSGGAVTVGYGSSLIDVTDTSNVKVKFSALSFSAGTSLEGSTDINTTHFTFIKLGDT